SPVFIWRQAPLWLMLSATIERTTHRSSTHPAVWGRSSETAVPDSPCCLNFHGEVRRLPVLVRTRLGMSNGNGLAWSRASSGLGSNKATCDGPPDMNRKITRLARGAKWGAGREPGIAPPPNREPSDLSRDELASGAAARASSAKTPASPRT